MSILTKSLGLLSNLGCTSLHQNIIKIMFFKSQNGVGLKFAPKF